jgi:hypothetical protein
MHVEISNKVRLSFDRPKAKPFKAVGESSSMIAHWLHKITLEEQSLQILGAKLKSQKHK